LLNVGIASLIVRLAGPAAGVSGNVLAGVIAPFAGVLIGFMWNFIGYKFFIFKK